jgi:methionine synthase II (cobalamin-independent)
MPGEDVRESLRIIRGEVGDFAFVPELPARGPHAGMIGRALAVLDGLEGDLQPGGWRLGVGSGSDFRRARSLLAQDLDVAEEMFVDHSGWLKVQVTGPLTLAANVERERGDKLVADHGARRELAESLAAGLTTHVADVRRRFGWAEQVVVQVDEPSITAVLGGGVPTASGFGRHRTVQLPEADSLLRLVVDAIIDAGARPVVHSCAADVPVSLLAGAGFTAISFDLGLAEPDDGWSQLFEAGTDLWPGVVPSTDAEVTDSDLRRRVELFFDRLGFDEDAYAHRTVVTPTCGLAGASPAWARRALSLAQAVAGASVHSGEERDRRSRRSRPRR